MSFASLSTPHVDDLVARFAAAGRLTLIVGAGASMEALLPSWPALVERLLRRVAAAQPALRTRRVQEDWIRHTLDQEDLLAAGAIVEVMASQGLEELLPAELFGDGGPSAYEPGPIALQAAALRLAFGDRAAILTTNYDDLLERALLAGGVPRRRIRSYVRRAAAPAGAVVVTHLHGYAGRDGPPKRLVLTEEHYHRMQRGTSWQEQEVTARLEDSLCLFVGTSLTDPNLIRYLYGYRQSPARRHAAVFIRQGEPAGVDDAVRAVREEAVARRWERCGVEALFLDHFADAAQLLYEIRHRRDEGDAYVPVRDRAADAVGRIGRTALCLDAGDAAFAERQVALSRWLRDTLHLTLRSALGGEPPGGERLALALWLVSEDGRRLTGWAHSDRAHQDPDTIESVALDAASPWVAVRTVCQGVRVERDHRSEVSRWRFVRGLPLVLSSPSRLPVGCLTLSSTRPGSSTVLTRMSPGARKMFHDGLLATFEPALERMVAAPV